MNDAVWKNDTGNLHEDKLHHKGHEGHGDFIGTKRVKEIGS
jgi:hypothetical protein